MSKYLVTVTEIAEVWTYVVVDAADEHEASRKAVHEVRQDGAGRLKRDLPRRLLNATRIEPITGRHHASGDHGRSRLSQGAQQEVAALFETGISA